jgi:uncharacterized protein YbjT (DUF2867 family)
MKVLILGATGHIGNAIVREFLRQGHHVTAVRTGDKITSRFRADEVGEASWRWECGEPNRAGGEG